MAENNWDGNFWNGSGQACGWNLFLSCTGMLAKPKNVGLLSMHAQKKYLEIERKDADLIHFASITFILYWLIFLWFNSGTHLSLIKTIYDNKWCTIRLGADGLSLKWSLDLKSSTLRRTREHNEKTKKSDKQPEDRPVMVKLCQQQHSQCSSVVAEISVWQSHV